MKKKRKIKKLNLIILIMTIICFIVLIISIFNIIKWKQDSKETEKQIEEIYEKTEVVEVNNEETTEIIEPQEEIPEVNPYWDYIKMNLIDVDFNKLKQTNNSTVGWIQINGTNINYPFVQATDNKYYLNRSFDKTYNSAGWVFLDYRNNINNLDKNNIIYAHGRFDNTMFGSLKNILLSGWANNPNNYIVKLSTESHNTMWQVFSVYRIPTTSDYLKVNFKDNNEFLRFANMLLNRSNHNFNTTINENDKIITLSTCHDNNEKVVLHAKLIKIETK